MIKLSPLGWSVFEQLRDHKSVEDGNIISKSGRDELIRSGYALRTLGLGGLAFTNLTSKGQVAVIHLSREFGRA